MVPRIAEGLTMIDPHDESEARLAASELAGLAAEARHARARLARLEEHFTAGLVHHREIADRFYREHGERNPVLDAPVAAALSGLPDIPEGPGSHGEAHRRPHHARVASYRAELTERTRRL
jgi:hypothetical protein